VTDIFNISLVYAEVLFPNSSRSNVTLNLSFENKFNATFLIPNSTGSYNITYVANDSSNNINSTTITFFVGVDTEPPSVTGFVPSDGTTFEVADYC